MFRRAALTIPVIVILVAAVLIAHVNTTRAQRTSSRKAVPDPAVGDGRVSDFYIWDEALPPKPGMLLRQEPLPEVLMLGNASKGVRVLYTSRDGLDNKTPIAVSGAVFFPKGIAPNGGWPVIAWAHGTTGIADVCAPSWGPRSARDTDYLNAWLAQGYAVVATDYQGLGTPGGHPWLYVWPEAYSVLDSVRAVLNAFPALSKSVVIVGQSQGAHAAVSASLLSSRYSPDLHIKGTVATGVPGMPPFAPSTKAPQIPVPPLVGGPFPAFFLLDLLTYRILDPTLDPLDYLADDARPSFELARTGCFLDVARSAQQASLTVDDEFKKKLDELSAKAAPLRQYPPPRFRTPVFIGTGLADTTVFPESQYNFVMAACYAGSVVESHYYEGQDHPGTPNAALVDSAPFVKKLFAGEHITGNCSAVRPPRTAASTAN